MSPERQNGDNQVKEYYTFQDVKNALGISRKKSNNLRLRIEYYGAKIVPLEEQGHMVFTPKDFQTIIELERARMEKTAKPPASTPEKLKPDLSQRAENFKRDSFKPRRGAFGKAI
jgi:hypothetical protein